MKILCVCGAGFCRSVAAASVLSEFGHHAIAKGEGSLDGSDPHRWTEEDVKWADVIVAFVPGAESVAKYSHFFFSKEKITVIIHLEDKWGFPVKAREPIKKLFETKKSLAFLKCEVEHVDN